MVHGSCTREESTPPMVHGSCAMRRGPPDSSYGARVVRHKRSRKRRGPPHDTLRYRRLS